ncbi:MAG: DMT family transporter [Desulfurella sp.]|uniref:DMT family transporter n=1 Tax=Desulfurella sp. TaxID=1962857 RepID=UPI003D129510
MVLNKNKIVLASLIGIIGVSFASIFIKECANVPSIVLSMYRLDIAAFILLLMNFINKNKLFPLSRKELLLGFASGVFLALHFYFWIASLKYTSIASSVVLVSTNPFFVVILSLILMKEKISPKVVIALIASFVGTVIITASDGNLLSEKIDKTSLFGDILAIIGAFSVSFYFIIGSKLRKNMDTNRYVTLVYTFAAIFITILAIFANEDIIHYSSRDFSFIFLLAIVPQLIGHTAFNWALKYLKATAVAITTLGEIIGSTMLAYIFFQQTINLWQFIGILFIMSAIVISFRYGKV